MGHWRIFPNAWNLSVNPLMSSGKESFSKSKPASKAIVRVCAKWGRGGDNGEPVQFVEGMSIR